jgi:hypothetical protein
MTGQTVTSQCWTEDERDQVYTELCRAITEAGPAHETLYLAKLCLLLVEELKSREAALKAIAQAKDGTDSA